MKRLITLLAVLVVAVPANAALDLETFDNPAYYTTVCKYVAAVGVMKHTMRTNLPEDEAAPLINAFQGRVSEFVMEDQRQSDIVLVRLDNEDAQLVASLALIVQASMVELDTGINYYNVVNTGTDLCQAALSGMHEVMKEGES